MERLQQNPHKPSQLSIFVVWAKVENRILHKKSCHIGHMMSLTRSSLALL